MSYSRTNDIPRLASALSLLGLSLCGGCVAQATNLVPTSYVTTSGADGGQPVSTSIDLLDESGTTNNWDKYVEFQTTSTATYAGYRVYTLPATIAPASIIGLQVTANYMGPSTSTQTWTWRLYDWVQAKYVAVGTNAGAPSWGSWKLLSFNAGGTLSNYVRTSDRQIRVQLISNNSADNADIDYEAVVVSTASSTPVGISLSPTSATVQTGQLQQFTASVTGSTNTAVTWQVNGITGGNSTVGTISSTGLYTAPSTAPSGRTVTVKAIAQADTTKSGSATVTVTTAVAGQAYYVATTGSDSNPGTFALPWRTVQHAANSVTAGNTVYVRGGVYNEQVKIRRSGSATGGYITFRNYPGEAAIIDGSGLSPNGQSGLVDIQNQSYVIVQGLEIRNFKTSSSSNVPIGIYIAGAGANIQVIGNHVHDIVTSVTSSSGNAFGVAVYGTSGTASIGNLVISGNEVDHLVTGQSESMTINGNVQNFQVTNNRVHDNNNIGIDVIGFEGTSPTGSVDQARDGVISGNTVYNITSAHNPAYGNSLGADGIYVDGGTRITIERNLVHHADLGIELASEHSGKVTSYVTARSNIVHDCYMVGISIGGYASTVGGTDHCTIVNNTLYNDDINSTGTGEFQIQYHATNNVFDNNIVYAGAQGLFVNNFTTNSTPPASLNYNLYYSSAGASNETWLWNNVTETGFPAFQSTGNDLASKFANPQFVNAAALDFHVASTSPAVDAGTNLGQTVEGPLDFAGNPRVQGANIDIGAYEQ